MDCLESDFIPISQTCHKIAQRNGGRRMGMKILIAEDDPVLRQLICDILRKNGYETVEARNGKEAMDHYFASPDIALCILDVMMPIYDGWEVLEEIRLRSEVPILMLTALGDEENEIKGLTQGADDYIAKPFSYPVLVARVKALLRPAKRKVQETTSIGQIRMDRLKRQVWVMNQEITLNNKEYSLLNYLVKNQGIVLDRDRILESVWGYDFEGDIRTIDAHIKMLRSKLDACSSYIKTVRGVGYVFEGDYEEKHTK